MHVNAAWGTCAEVELSYGLTELHSLGLMCHDRIL